MFIYFVWRFWRTRRPRFKLVLSHLSFMYMLREVYALPMQQTLILHRYKVMIYRNCSSFLISVQKQLRGIFSD